MKNLQQLETERQELRAQINTATKLEPILVKLKANEVEIQKLKAIELLRNVNATQERKRILAIQAWNCEQPSEDITCNDGSLHKVKAKKYPILASIKYLSLTYKDGVTTEMRINGERFYMVKSKYEYNKPTEYTRPATFLEFLELNSIQAEDITAEQFSEFSQKLNEANKELEKAIEIYDKKRKELNVYQMQHIGLVNQQNKHLYIYEAKKY
jgi:hypothetical protein